MYKIYVVEYDDTLNRIADKFSVSTEVIERLNGANVVKNLTPGMQIVVPATSDTPFFSYIVEKGDSVYEIARKNNVNYRDLLLINGLDENDYIYPGQEILIPRAGYSIYLAAENDTVNTVSSKLGLKPSELISQNGSLYLMPNQIIIYKKEKTV
jgi:LysM repeat protein